MEAGPIAAGQLRRFHNEWKQGEHVLVIGPTGSGKTTLARKLLIGRERADGFVVVFVCKLRRDATLDREYRGYRRWNRFKAKPTPQENRILLWPDTKGMTLKQAIAHQREVFGEALDIISQVGHWCIDVDEGYYFSHSGLLNLGTEWGAMHALGRSSAVTCLTLAQRPSHIPIMLYGSASHAFLGQTKEEGDRKRLADLGSQESARELQIMLSSRGKRDFLWVPAHSNRRAEEFNLAK